MQKQTHWTEDSIRDYVYKIAADFLQQIENSLSEEPQAVLANRLGVTPGRVSQVMNNPGNLSLKTIVQYARVLGKKVTIVAYDDHDPDNLRGPINSQVFEECWVRQNRPCDFLALNEADAAASFKTYLIAPEADFPLPVAPVVQRANTAFQLYGFDSASGTDADREPVSPGIPGVTNGRA
jgi:hypothetical protein